MLSLQEGEVANKMGATEGKATLSKAEKGVLLWSRVLCATYEHIG